MALEITSLTKSYGSKIAVSDISFQVQSGQVYGLLGMNGAGKTTTLRMILGILTPDAGAITWQGKTIDDTVRQTFGYLPEERGLYQKMKVLDQLVFFARLHGLTKQAAMHEAIAWLERFEIESYRDRKIGDLSKGNQQKVQFIAAVIHHPSLVVLDEPFSGLDPINVQLFLKAMKHLVQEGSTMIFSSHQLQHVEELGDAVGMIHGSRLVLDGKMEEILRSCPPRELKMRADETALLACRDLNLAPEFRHGYYYLPIQSQVEASHVLRQMTEKGGAITHFELVGATLQDVFLSKVGESA